VTDQTVGRFVDTPEEHPVDGVATDHLIASSVGLGLPELDTSQVLRVGFADGGPGVAKGVLPADHVAAIVVLDPLGEEVESPPLIVSFGLVDCSSE